MKKALFLKLLIPLIGLVCIVGFSPHTLKFQDKGLSLENYLKKVNTKDSTVLVYFFADWCVPCVKLKPIMAELEKENPSVKIIKLDVDENPEVALHFEINTLPLFYIYKNGKQVWINNTFINKQTLETKIRSYK